MPVQKHSHPKLLTWAVTNDIHHETTLYANGQHPITLAVVYTGDEGYSLVEIDPGETSDSQYTWYGHKTDAMRALSRRIREIADRDRQFAD